MTFTVRPANASDVEALFDIRTSVTQNHLSREQMAQMGIDAETLTAMLSAGPCAWLAEVEGLPVAFSMIDLDDACLFAVFVRPGHEGRGLGSAVLAPAEAALFAQHARIWLSTDGREEIRANGFYRRHGWQVVAQLQDGDVRYEKAHPSN
ncbi:GNAT family N-acetyltransferase [Stenotrophomonas sp. SY1]|uniref:GNAT family N-acetyltransferase n=1 Tax=Stenotrophomonas sp. SY1 TaxID=477235 RepID=UPI001E39CD37|nr:GNAT family N-acetyltransferase [Stenotrophomonas sp. SY1]MCD9085737.1 GNAT family N-acetyltransferase [Stenotrophomonas sp. SY1]